MLLFIYVTEVILHPPVNVTIREIHHSGASVQWQLVNQPAVTGVEITVNQLGGQTPGEGLKNFIIQVSGHHME